MNMTQAAARRLKMSERAQQQLELHFPSLDPLWIWSRQRDSGFISVPRILPIAMQAVDEGVKGSAAGHVLFCLWARSPDHVLLTIDNPHAFAIEAGCGGIRALDTWRRKMRTLREMQFILTKEGSSGEFHYVLLMNPIASVEYMWQMGKVQQALYGRFLDRLADIGAHDQLKAFQAAWQAQREADVKAAAASAGTPAAAVTSPGT